MLYFLVRSNNFETTDYGAQEDDQVSVNTMVEKGELTESILMASGRFQVLISMHVTTSFPQSGWCTSTLAHLCSP